MADPNFEASVSSDVSFSRYLLKSLVVVMMIPRQHIFGISSFHVA
jgi:hypothetical protein